MDLSKKLEYADSHLKSISQHSDVDASVRKAALDRVIDMAQAQKAVIDAEVKAQVEALVFPPPV